MILELEEGLNQENQVIDLRQHALLFMSIVKSNDSASMSNPIVRGFLHNLFASLYGDWKTKLLQDQEKEARNSSLYTYKGLEDDADEEDPTLFPDYEAEQDKEQTPRISASYTRDLAIRLANTHAELFIQGPEAFSSIKSLLGWCSEEMNHVSSSASHGYRV